MPRTPEPLQRAARDRLHGLAGPTSTADPGGSTAAPEIVGAPDVLPGWVPGVPSGVDGTGQPDGIEAATTAPGEVAAAPDAQDVRDVVARIRAGALANAASSYTSRYGHPLEHPSPDAPAGARRWQLSVRLALVAAVAIVVLGAGVVVRATLSAPSVPVVTPPVAGASLVAGASGPAEGESASAAAGGAGAEDSGAAAPEVGGAVVVHVVGQVNAPGVVRLTSGARVADAVAAAGGAAAGAALAAVNLARVVEDGEQIVVPAPGEVVPGAAAAGDGAGSGGAVTGAQGTTLVDLNTADAAELEALPGIGPVLAQRIVDWRTEHTRFTAVEELGEVAGIGDTLLGRLRDLVQV